MGDRLAVIATFRNDIEAEIARAVLARHDLPSMLVRDDAGGMYPGLFVGSPVRLAVQQRHADEARQVLARQAGDVPPGEEDEG